MVTFLGHLKAKLGRKRKQPPFAVFWDNCRTHITLTVKEFCEAENINLIFNVSYRPDLNSIERLWKDAKLDFRKRLDWHKANFEPWDL